MLPAEPGSLKALKKRQQGDFSPYALSSREYFQSA
jgi:hypothetical protein